MSEPVKNLRLAAVAKECNVGVAHVVELLKTKGFEVENKPTTKLTDEMYMVCLKEYNADALQKLEAASVNLNKGHHEVLQTKKQDEFIGAPKPKEEDEPKVSVIKSQVVLQQPKVVGMMPKKEKPVVVPPAPPPTCGAFFSKSSQAFCLRVSFLAGLPSHCGTSRAMRCDMASTSAQPAWHAAWEPAAASGQQPGGTCRGGHVKLGRQSGVVLMTPQSKWVHHTWAREHVLMRVMACPGAGGVTLRCSRRRCSCVETVAICPRQT